MAVLLTDMSRRIICAFFPGDVPGTLRAYWHPAEERSARRDIRPKRQKVGCGLPPSWPKGAECDLPHRLPRLIDNFEDQGVDRRF